MRFGSYLGSNCILLYATIQSDIIGVEISRRFVTKFIVSMSVVQCCSLLSYFAHHEL